MNRLDQLLEQQGRPTLRGWPWLIMALLAAFLIWAYVATLERVVVAEGEVAPQGRVKVIQHLEGGVIEAFHVAEGDRVASGDPLVSLNIAAAGLNRSEIDTALAARRVTAIRLAAEADGSVPDFATAGADRRAPLVAAELAVFVARRAELDSEIVVLQEQQARLDRELEESKAKRHAIQENLSLAGRELELVTALFEEKLVAELKVLNAQQTVTRLAGELDVHNRVINTRQSKRTESEAVIVQAKARFYRRAREEAALNQAEIAGLEERLKLASDQARRATIRSPIDGEVKNLRYHTVGGVVTPGDAILQIVPVSGQLVIDAELAPADRGLVASGLAANVKITAYDFIRYGGLEGTVTHLAPDTSTTDSGDSFYRLVVTTEKAYLGNDPNQNQITPGMDAIVEIKVGSQSVLDFLLRPVLKTRDEAFREP